MKLPPARIEQFIKKPDASIRFILLYGPDTGLVTMRAQGLTKAILGENPDALMYCVMDYTKIKDDPACIADEYNSFSLFGGKKVIRVLDTKTLPKVTEQFIKETGDGQNMVVFEAGELAPASPLRKLFETVPHAVAIPCYKDDESAIATIVLNYMRERGYTCMPEALQALQYRFYGDRMVMYRELEKLLLYVGEKNKTVTLEDVTACIEDNKEHSIENICLAVASAKPSEADRALQTVLQEGIPVVVIVRALMYYFLRLYTVKLRIRAGMPEKEAMDTLTPPVFFKQAPQFRHHLSLWDEEDIKICLERFFQLEEKCKHTHSPAELLCAQAILIAPTWRKKK